MPHLVR